MMQININLHCIRSDVRAIPYRKCEVAECLISLESVVHLALMTIDKQGVTIMHRAHFNISIEFDVLLGHFNLNTEIVSDLVYISKRNERHTFGIPISSRKYSP